MTKLSLKELPLKGKRVLMRVDFNVPFKSDGTIADDSRIQAALPSIQYILKEGGSVILMSHLGSPKGKKDPKLSLKPCAQRLSELLGLPVTMAPDCRGKEVETLVKNLQPKQLLLLENLRYYPAEESPEKDPSFAKELASFGDVYVNDAFGTAHRKHSSTFTIASLFPKKAAAGFLMEKEISFLGKLLENPQRPFYAIIGGAKISTKIGVIRNLITKVDGLFVGGGMAYTFFRAQGVSIGDSPYEESEIATVKEILSECKKKKVSLSLPLDWVIADGFKAEAQKRTISVEEGIPAGWQGMDIGPKTIEAWKASLLKGATIFWNGPLGVFELAPFAQGTRSIAQALSSSSATTIVGGGDSLAAIHDAHLEEKFTHLSTGGGASLEFLELGYLPGVDALTDK